MVVRFAASVWLSLFSADVQTLFRLCLPRSSVAFLAIQNLVDFAQFFILMSIGLSLGCVVMGFNSGLDERLSQLQYIELPNPSYVTQLYFIRLVKPGSISQEEKLTSDRDQSRYGTTLHDVVIVRPLLLSGVVGIHGV